MHKIDKKPTGRVALVNLYTRLENLQGDFRNKNLNNLVISRLKGSSLLDIGCGAGHLLILARGKGFRTFGIEPNMELIRIGEALYGKKLKIKKLPAEKVDTIKTKFDNIVLVDVIEHLENDLLVLEKTRKLLSKDGRLIIVTSAYPRFYGERDKRVGHFRRYSRKELLGRLGKSGYSIHEARYWDAIGVLPYFFCEKILGISLPLELRNNKNQGFGIRVINHLLGFWFKYVENGLNFGFGLTLFIVAFVKNGKRTHPYV